jgi:hypothetical protein
MADCQAFTFVHKPAGKRPNNKIRTCLFGIIVDKYICPKYILRRILKK